MNYSKYDTYDIYDDPHIEFLNWREEMLRCDIEKTRKKAIFRVITKLAELHIKLAELNHPDFVDREVLKLTSQGN